MESILFIVWRESIEGVLIVSILYTYLMRSEQGRQGLKYLWAGVAGGLGLSLVLGLATLWIQSDLQERQMEYFRIGLEFAAAALMTQMVLWMRRRGPQLKHSLQSGVDRAMDSGSLIGVSVVALLSIAREGAETVVYVYGLGLEHGAAGMSITGAVALGFVLALATAWGVSKGVRFLNYRVFFRVTEIILLFSAAGLVVGGVSGLVAMDILPALVGTLWNTSAILDSGSRVGSIVAALTGYRSQPSLILVLAYAAFWVLTLTLLNRPVARPAANTRAAA
jgi:high-affinity iron transporter